MAYTVIPAGDIVAGQPTKEEIFDQIRTNQESFNTDIEALKQTSTFDVFDVNFNGSLDQYTSTEITEKSPVFKAPVGLTLTSFTLTLLGASTSGTLSVNIDKSTDNGINWSQMASSDVSLTGTTIGSISGSVTWSITSVAQNDLIRIRVTGLQVNQGQFQLSVYSEVS